MTLKIARDQPRFRDIVRKRICRGQPHASSDVEAVGKPDSSTISVSTSGIRVPRFTFGRREQVSFLAVLAISCAHSGAPDPKAPADNDETNTWPVAGAVSNTAPNTSLEGAETHQSKAEEERLLRSDCEHKNGRCLEVAQRLGEATRVLESEGDLSYGAGGEHAEEALALFDALLAEVPGSDAAHLGRARALLSLGRGFLAQEELAPLAERYVGEAEVQGAYGISLLSTGRTRESLAPLEQAARLEPEVGERQVAVGTVQMLLGKLTAAERSYRAALSLDPGSARIHGDLGTLLTLMGRTKEGIPHLRRAIALEPKKASFRSNLAYAQFVEGKLDAAEETARAATRLDPELASAWLNLGLVRAKQGDRNEAQEAFLRAKELSPDDPRVLENLKDLAQVN